MIMYCIGIVSYLNEADNNKRKWFDSYNICSEDNSIDKSVETKFTYNDIIKIISNKNRIKQHNF